MERGKTTEVADKSEKLTVLETLRSMARGPGKEGTTDTFLNMAVQTLFFRESSAANLDLFVYAPSNKAFQNYLNVEPDRGLKLGGPDSTFAVFTMVKNLMKPRPPGWSEYVDIDKLKAVLTTEDVVIQCKDGVLIITSTVWSEFPAAVIDVDEAALEQMRRAA
jgi:hypothetical protein